MKSGFLLFTFLLFAMKSHGSIQEAWNPDSDPAIMHFDYKRQFSDLPLKGKVKSRTKLWSGDYWALNKGNINYRWFSRNKIGFNLDSPSFEGVKKMTLSELAELSPSEKYDIFTGKYDYPLKTQVEKIANPKAFTWEGICHGWSPATLNHDEPRPKLMINPDGLEIPFGSTDIKALLSFYYAHVHKAQDTHQMGKRCYEKPSLNDGVDCLEDMNAGAFHLILGNRVGLSGRSVIADLQRYQEVWNHPVTAYESKIISNDSPFRNSAPGTLKTIRLQTTVTYLDENGNDWHPVIGTQKQKYMTEVYDYRLDVNEKGEVIGGNWLSKKRPDFLWYMNKARRFEGVLSRLEELLDDE